MRVGGSGGGDEDGASAGIDFITSGWKNGKKHQPGMPGKLKCCDDVPVTYERFLFCCFAVCRQWCALSCASSPWKLIGVAVPVYGSVCVCHRSNRPGAQEHKDDALLGRGFSSWG